MSKLIFLRIFASRASLNDRCCVAFVNSNRKCCPPAGVPPKFSHATGLVPPRKFCAKSKGMALSNGLPWKWTAECRLRLLDSDGEPPIRRSTVGETGNNKHPSVASALIEQNCAKTSATSGIVHGDRKALL